MMPRVGVGYLSYRSLLLGTTAVGYAERINEASDLLDGYLQNRNKGKS